MAQCELCGNEYDKTFEVVMAGKSHVFDSFECAISALAPTCNHCGCRIIGHGVEVQGALYCCANCAKKEGAQGVQNRSEPAWQGQSSTETSTGSSVPVGERRRAAQEMPDYQRPTPQGPQPPVVTDMAVDISENKPPPKLYTE